MKCLHVTFIESFL